MSKRPFTTYLDSMREAIRNRHYSIRTEPAYLGWIKQFTFYFMTNDIQME